MRFGCRSRGGYCRGLVSEICDKLLIVIYFLANCETASILNMSDAVPTGRLVLIYYFQEEKDITDVFVYDA